MSQTIFIHYFKWRTNQFVSVHFPSSLLPLHSKPSIVPLQRGQSSANGSLTSLLASLQSISHGASRLILLNMQIKSCDQIKFSKGFSLNAEENSNSFKSFHTIVFTYFRAHHVWPLSSRGCTYTNYLFLPFTTKIIPALGPGTGSFLSWARSCQQASSCLSGVRLIAPFQWEIPQQLV